MDVATDLLDAHLEQINARLPNASPHAAYALGMLTVVHIETRKPIPTVLLDAAIEIEMGSVAEACRLGQQARDYAALGQPKLRRRSA